MTDAAARAARDDLAFLKAVAEDRGPLPAILGAHMLAVGAAFAPSLVLVWAIFAGRIAWPESLMGATWAPGVALWLPAYLYLQMRGRGREGFGPSARVFAAAWGAMGLMTVTSVAVLIAASIATGQPMYKVWPALGFVLWGGAWTVVAIIRRRLWLGGVAAASFVLGVGCGALAQAPEVWLVMAAGLLLVFALPGAVILRLAPRSS